MNILPSESIEESTRHGHLTSFRSVLSFLVGQMVTLVDSESLEEAPVGRYLDMACHEAKVLRAGEDYLLLVRELTHQHGEDHAEKIRLFLPIDRIKRITLMEEERLIHI